MISPVPVTREDADKTPERSHRVVVSARGAAISEAHPFNQGGQGEHLCCVSCQRGGADYRNQPGQRALGWEERAGSFLMLRGAGQRGHPSSSTDAGALWGSVELPAQDNNSGSLCESFQAFQAASGCFSPFDVCLGLMENGWIEMS